MLCIFVELDVIAVLEDFGCQVRDAEIPNSNEVAEKCGGIVDQGVFVFTTLFRFWDY